jgi:hypothetical protein
MAMQDDFLRKLWGIEPTCGRMECAVFVHEPEIQRTTVCKPESQFKAQSMKAWDVERIRAADTALDLQIRRHRLTLLGEMLIHGEMVVNPTEAAALFKEIAIANRLLDKALHCHRTSIDRTSEAARLRCS